MQDSITPMRRSKRVLHVIRRLDVAGGAERIVCDLVRACNEYHVLIFDGKEPFYPLPENKVIRANGFLRACCTVMRMSKEYDCVHLHLFPAIYMAIFLGNKSIIHEHNTYNRRRKIKLFRIIEQFVYSRAKIIIAISNAVQKSLQDWLGNSVQNIVVLHNFVPKIIQRGKQEDVRVFKNSRNIVIGMIASFTCQKRQDLLIQSLTYLPQNFYIIFAGDGPRLEACRRIAKDFRLDDRVTFLGTIKDVDNFYRSVDVCVLLSQWEGFGLVVVEAASYGKVTVVSDIEGLKEICPDKRLLVTEHSPKAVAGVIRRVVQLSRRGTFDNALKYLVNKYSISEYQERLDKIYEAPKK